MEYKGKKERNREEGKENDLGYLYVLLYRVKYVICKLGMGYYFIKVGEVFQRRWKLSFDLIIRRRYLYKYRKINSNCNNFWVESFILYERKDESWLCLRKVQKGLEWEIRWKLDYGRFFQVFQ